MKTATSDRSFVLVLAGHRRPPRPPPAPRRPAHGRRRRPVGTSAHDTANDYRLAAGDKLRIEVYKDTQLSQSLQIRPDGKITLPLVGDVAAAGRTPIELRDAIGGALEGLHHQPGRHRHRDRGDAAQVVYVTGEVNKPGPRAAGRGRMSVLQALAMAGGFTDFANKKDIRILRKGATGMQTLKFNYKDALDEEQRARAARSCRPATPSSSSRHVIMPEPTSSSDGPRAAPRWPSARRSSTPAAAQEQPTELPVLADSRAGPSRPA